MWKQQSSLYRVASDNFFYYLLTIYLSDQFNTDQETEVIEHMCHAGG